MYLTDHFTTQEFERSSFALRHGIDNKMPNRFIYPATILCEMVLEPLRVKFQSPVLISSGYRCPELNTAIGGAENSQHMFGQAADIINDNLQELELWLNWIRKNCNYDQLIKERASPSSKSWWIHVSCKPEVSKNRHQFFMLNKNK